jgi:hypothetical protein
MCSDITSMHLTFLEPGYRWTRIWQQHARFLGVVIELLMNPINFYVDCSSRLINSCSD